MSTRTFNKRPAPGGGADYHRGGDGNGDGNGAKFAKKKFVAKGKPSSGGGYAGNKPKPAWMDKGKGRGGSQGNGFSGAANGGHKAPAADTGAGAGIRRKRPITAGGGEMEIDEDEGEGDDDAEGEADIEMDEGVAPGTRVVNDAGEPMEKRPRMTKVERAALHAAQPHRTSLLPSHPLLHDTLLPLWETARRADLPKDERVKAVRELWESVKGRVLEISKGHKGGRVLQTIVKYGGKEERNGVAMELQPQWRQMMESKYSKFLMGKLIRYCPSIRPLLIASLAPHLTSLLFHSDAVGPLSDFFDLWATSKERRLLVRGFYPKEVQLFDGLKVKGGGLNFDGEVKGLEGSLEALGDGGGRERVLDGIEKTVLDVFNNTQKTALAQGIFHRLVSEYLDCIYRFLTPEQADQKMHELLTTSLESLPDIVHTKDGSSVVRQLLVRGNAKDRKQILQPLRKHIEAMAKDADAQLVLFTAFDVVDDTKLMGKAFVTDILALGSTLAFDKNGRRALLYLLVPTSTRHNIPSTLTALAASAKSARELGTSKKDPATRRKELLSYGNDGLLQLVEEKGEEMIRDAGAGLLVHEIMLNTEGDKSKAIASLVKPLSAPYSLTVPDEEPPAAAAAEESSASSGASATHVLNLPHALRTYRTMLSGGRLNRATSSIDVVAPALRAETAKAIWEAITSEDAGGDENALRVATGEGTFMLVEVISALVESESDTDSADEIKGIRAVLGKKSKQIESSGRNGAALLAEKLRAL